MKRKLIYKALSMYNDPLKITGSTLPSSCESSNCNSSVDALGVLESFDSDGFKPVYEASDASAEESPKKLILEPVIYSRKERTVTKSMRFSEKRQVCSRY